jgi:hypothetical protein
MGHASAWMEIRKSIVGLPYLDSFSIARITLKGRWIYKGEFFNSNFSVELTEIPI